MTNDARTIFHNARQALKVRLVFWFAQVIGLVALYAGWHIFLTYGLSPGDGGVLRSFGQRAAFGGFVALLGIIVAGGMWLYIWIYVLDIETGPRGIRIALMRPIGQKVSHHTKETIGPQHYHAGRLHWIFRSLSGLTVNAPWMTLWTKGASLPLILDMQADLIDRPALRRLSPEKAKRRRR